MMPEIGGGEWGEEERKGFKEFKKGESQEEATSNVKLWWSGDFA